LREGKFELDSTTANQVIAGVFFVVVSALLVEPGRASQEARTNLFAADWRHFRFWQETKGSK